MYLLGNTFECFSGGSDKVRLKGEGCHRPRPFLHVGARQEHRRSVPERGEGKSAADQPVRGQLAAQKLLQWHGLERELAGVANAGFQGRELVQTLSYCMAYTFEQYSGSQMSCLT